MQNVTQFKELDSAKTNFIANVSHEFKTPISSIKMSVQLLENNKTGLLNKEQQNLIESINDDAGRLLKITSELLNMTQVESGSIQINLMPSHPKEMIQYAIDATKTQADHKEIKFQINCPSNILQVQADSEKTTWVLTNLITNAIRFSHEKSIIYIEVYMENNHVKFSVTDKGKGIPPEYLDKLFNHYFQVPDIKKEGTGLGLAISKEFIEAQGGIISVKSEYGVGSTFVISLKPII